MEKTMHISTNSSPASSEGFRGRFHGRTRFRFGAFLRSIFSCSGSSVEYDEGPPMYKNHTPERLVGSVKKPKKQRRSRHSASKTTISQQKSSIAISTALKKPDSDECRKEVSDKIQLASIDSVKETQETPLPNISEPSAILSESLRGLLCTHLPTLAQGCDWVLLYSTWKHGISLRTLYRNSSHLSGPYLLAVQDSEGVVLGGLLTGPLDPTKQKFQGTHESFLFTNVPADVTIYGATGCNRYYHLCTNEMLGMGGGRTFALRLDEDLTHGSSGVSETFANCCLSFTEEFNIRNVELWGFAHTSKYVQEKVLYRPPQVDSPRPGRD